MSPLALLAVITIMMIAYGGLFVASYLALGLPRWAIVPAAIVTPVIIGGSYYGTYQIGALMAVTALVVLWVSRPILVQAVLVMTMAMAWTPSLWGFHITPAVGLATGFALGAFRLHSPAFSRMLAFCGVALVLAYAVALLVASGSQAAFPHRLERNSEFEFSIDTLMAIIGFGVGLQLGAGANRAMKILEREKQCRFATREIGALLDRSNFGVAA